MIKEQSLCNTNIPTIMLCSRNLKIGAKILNIDVPCTAFADDLDMIILSIPAMQIMVNKAADFGHRWQLEFNVPKRTVLEYSKQACNNTVRLKHQLIPKLNSINNFGTLLKLSSERDIEFTEGRISSARRCASYLQHSCSSEPHFCS